MSGQKYRGVRVTKHNVALDTYKVSFDHCGMRFYDIFRNKETADFWAGKLKSGEWDPLKDSPTNALRDQLEVVG